MCNDRNPVSTRTVLWFLSLMPTLVLVPVPKSGGVRGNSHDVDSRAHSASSLAWDAFRTPLQRPTISHE